MAHSRNGGRRKLIVVFLLILSIVLVAADRHGTLAASGHWVAARLFQPAQSVSRSAALNITGGAAAGQEALPAADPSGDAQAQAALQSAKIADLEQQLREVKQITKALANYPLVLIPTRIISAPYLASNTPFSLDAGTKRGVGKGQLVLYRALGQGKAAGLKHGQQVVTGMGIVGVVDRVGDSVSQMKLVTSSDCRLAARIVHWDGRSHWVARGGGADGTTEGAGDGVLVKLLHVDRTVDVRAGDYVVTASNDTGLAENLIIGQVAQVSTRSADLTHTILVQPRAELAKLDEVYVLSTPVK
jgi:cell shape-determining protein MreC